MRLWPSVAAACLLALALAVQTASATQVLSRLRNAAANAESLRANYARSFPAMSMGSVDVPEPALNANPKNFGQLHPTIIQDTTPAVKLEPPPFVPPPPAPEPQFQAPSIPTPSSEAARPLPRTGDSAAPCPQIDCIGSSITRIVSSFDAEERAAAKQAKEMEDFRRALRKIPKGFNDELRDASKMVNRASTLRAVTDKFVQDATTRLYNIIRKADKVKCASMRVARSALKQVVRAMPAAVSVLGHRPDSLPPPKINQSPAFSSGFRFRELNPNEVVFHVGNDRTPVQIDAAEDAAEQEFSSLASAFPAATAANDPECDDS